LLLDAVYASVLVGTATRAHIGGALGVGTLEGAESVRGFLFALLVAGSTSLRALLPPWPRSSR